MAQVTRKKALTIEDDPDILEDLTYLLKIMGSIRLNRGEQFFGKLLRLVYLIGRHFRRNDVAIGASRLVAGRGRDAVPGVGFDVVLRYASTRAIHVPEIDLRLAMTLPGRFGVPVKSGVVALLHPQTQSVHQAELKLCLLLPLLGARNTTLECF